MGTIRFHYDLVNDIHFAYPKWHIETEGDCRIWASQYVAYFSKFDRKVDVIFVLDDFAVGTKIGPVWGKYRAEWVNRYTRYSVRVRLAGRARAFNATSAAIYGGGFEDAPDEQQAIAQIRKQRESAAG